MGGPTVSAKRWAAGLANDNPSREQELFEHCVERELSAPEDS
ncbi:hypothetical protein [Erythrobacter sp. MTPC3]